MFQPVNKPRSDRLEADPTKPRLNSDCDAARLLADMMRLLVEEKTALKVDMNVTEE